MASPSGTVVLLAYTFFSFEFVTDIFLLAVACLNLAVIGPTKLLHPNLKCILITQSVIVVLYVLIRSAILLPKFISNDDLFAPATMILQSLMNFNAIFRRMLGHVLIIEQFVATFITFIIAFVNMATKEQSWTVTSFNLITSILSTILSFTEFLMIIIIWRYNQRKYNSQIEEASPNNYHIGQRYVVSHNVKTAKQLSPAFLCFFLSNLLMNILYMALTLDLATGPYEMTFAYGLTNWTTAILSAAIELTVITHHPLLKKRAIDVLKRIFRIFYFKHNQIDNATQSAELANNCRDGAYQVTEHFKMLNQLWNK
uniref:Gustatory receptor n=1 Tax=Globodera rostochiensis TaxID=31243 RepID=A0A914HAE9_GLORO